MKEVRAVIEKMKESHPNWIQNMRELPLQDIVIRVAAADVHEITDWLLKNSNYYHLSTITGLDNGEQIELYYHFWDGKGLSLHTTLPRELPGMDTITDLIPGASFYEREVFEMLGVKFENLDDSRRLLMADDWDGEHFPLRSEAKGSPKEEQK